MRKRVVLKNVLTAIVIAICFSAYLYSYIKYPMESGLYIFSKEGRAKAARDKKLAKYVWPRGIEYREYVEEKNMERREERREARFQRRYENSR